jgi:hypothetical protein
MGSHQTEPGDQPSLAHEAHPEPTPADVPAAEFEILAARLSAAPRETVLRFIASLIHGLTISVSDLRDVPDSEERIHAINRTIQRLSGHLRALSIFGEPLTETRIAGITGQIGFLPPDKLAIIERNCFEP